MNPTVDLVDGTEQIPCCRKDVVSVIKSLGSASDFGVFKAPTPSFRSDRPSAASADDAAAKVEWCTDLSLLDHLFGAEDGGVEDVVFADLEDHTVLFADVAQLCGFVEGECDGLLDADVFFCGGSLLNHLEVQACGSADLDGIEVWIVEHGLVIGVGLGDTPFKGAFGEKIGIGVAYRGEKGAWFFGVGADVKVGDAPASDKTDANGSLGHGVSLQQRGRMRQVRFGVEMC